MTARYIVCLLIFTASICISGKSVYADEIIKLNCVIHFEAEFIDEGRSYWMPFDVEQSITVNYTMKTADNFPAKINDKYIESSFRDIFNYRIDSDTGEMTLLDLAGSSKKTFRAIRGHGMCSGMNLAKYSRGSEIKTAMRIQYNNGR